MFELALEIAKTTGFLWRDTYIWNKPNPMIGIFPYKLKNGWEFVFHFAKSDSMKFYRDAVRQPKTESAIKDGLSKRAKIDKDIRCRAHRMNYKRVSQSDTALPSNVLTIAVGGHNKYDHPAVFPPKLPEFFIKLLSESGDVVLDPFCGSGTTLRAAHKLYRHAIGIDRESKYTKKLECLEDYSEDIAMQQRQY